MGFRGVEEQDGLIIPVQFPAFEPGGIDARQERPDGRIVPC